MNATNKDPGTVSLVEDILGDFGFRVRWVYDEHCTVVSVFKITGRTSAGQPQFEAAVRNGIAFVTYVEEAETYLKGRVKWDGCTDLYMGQTHWRGLEDYKKHCELLQYLYGRSQQLIKEADPDCFGGPWVHNLLS